MLKNWKFWLGVLISLLFLYLGLKGLKLGEVWQVLRQVKWWWLAPAVLVYFAGVWVRTWRWHFMLRPIKAILPQRLFPVMVIGYMGNNVYPARAGELIRAYILRKRENISISASLATIIVERILDGVVMVLFILFSLRFAPLPPWLQRVTLIGSLIFFGALLLFFAIATLPTHSKVVYDWFIVHLLPARLQPPVRGFADRFMQGLWSLRSARDAFMVLLTSPLIWLIETVFYWLVMQGFELELPFHVLMLMNGVANLGTIIPSSPGYVGTFDALGIKVLEGFAVPGSLAAGYTLLLHATLWLPITLLGFYYMWRESVTWTEFGAATQVKKEIANDA